MEVGIVEAIVLRPRLIVGKHCSVLGVAYSLWVGQPCLVVTDCLSVCSLQKHRDNPLKEENMRVGAQLKL
jgi:hypothetical protein